MTVRARRESWIASRSLSAGAHSRDPLARNDGERPAPSSRRHHLIADDDEFRQIHPPKARGERDVGGVAAGAHQDAADPGVIVAGGGRGTAAGGGELQPTGKKQPVPPRGGSAIAPIAPPP